ncbi:MAG: hypothetical protein ACK4UT_06865, partial [Moraxellaceae bacterium]
MRGRWQFSFRQSLLLAFLLVAGVLAGTAWHGLYTLDGLLAQNREATTLAVARTADVQVLREQAVSLLRASR